MSVRARSPVHRGVTIAGSGSCLPARRVTNNDLVAMMDTSDEWIVQRTGIRERRLHDPELEGTADLAIGAAKAAIADAGIAPTDVDLVIVGTMTPDAPTPGAASVVAAHIGAGHVGALDINGACCGFVFSLNVAHDLVNSGSAKTILLVGADTITQFCDFTTAGRNVAVLFGDAAAAVVLRASDDTTKGLLAQAMHSDGAGAKNLFVPGRKLDFPPNVEYDPRKIRRIYMDGQAVFKFAVGTFPKLIEQTLDKAGLNADEIDHYVCHQSNYRILDSARERFGLAPEKLHVNISRYGNTVSASVPLVFDELRKAGRVKPGQRVMFLAFGAGLTWGSSLWQL
jgi:3-oxoacyl-[acyl-carrier-protein] synthase-3